MKKIITIGSRGSELALYQSNFIREKISLLLPGIEIKIEIIKTRGDEIPDKPLAQIGDKGLFTKALEEALLSGSIDLAVHSLKDLQTSLPDGIILGAVTSEENPADVFISNKYNSIDELPEGATVATGSLRRQSQLLSYRNDLTIADVRGNIDTRLRKLDENNWDGMIMAFAGLNRLGLNERIRQLIPFAIMLPAVAQGVLGIEVNKSNNEILEIMEIMDDKNARIRVTAERSFLKELEGGCQIPIAAYCNVEDDKIFLEGMVGSIDGKIILREKKISDSNNAEECGKELAELLKERGAAAIIDEVRDNVK